MTLDEYQVISGENVPHAAIGQLEAQLQRTQRMLESALGYPLNSDEIANNQYNETGKVSTNADWPFNWNSQIGWYDDFIWGSDSLPTTLLPADPVINAYRMFDYRPQDRFLFIDPFTAIHAIKLVRNDVTVIEYTTKQYVIRKGRQPWSQYIDIGPNVPWWWGRSGNSSRYQIAVDADWLFEEIPEELKYIWADMVKYYMDTKTNVRSESIGAHSYTKFDNVRPQDVPSAQAVLQQYAGPHGDLSRALVL